MTDNHHHRRELGSASGADAARRPIVIGLVGGMGSGKSHVAEELARRGGRLVAGDPLGHEALRQSPIIERLVRRWGQQILDAKGAVDRRRVAALVFADSTERQALEAIVHPYIEDRFREQIEAAAHDPACRFVVLDAAILLEAGWQRFCDVIVYVDTLRHLRLKRLAQSRGWTAADVALREQAQMPLDDKRAHADYVIENSESAEKLARRVDELLSRLANHGLPAPAATRT